jgi:methanethiol S-methyltransferase
MLFRLRLAYVWLGAGLFVGSLLYFLYFYLIRLDRPAVPGGGPALVIDVLLFSVFALHHSVMARTGAKQWLTRFIPADLERSTYVWIASLLFIATCAWWQPIGGLVYEIHGAFAVLLHLVQAAGIVLVLAATRALRPLELAGVRQVDDVPAAALRTSGVYGWVRHPVYFGWVLFVFAAPRMTTDRLVFAIVSIAYLAMAVPFEERSLTEAFGNDYRQYARRVRWKMVPWIY